MPLIWVRSAAAVLVLLGAAAGCRPEGAPAISVDGLHFYDGEVAPLTALEMESLADLGALAATVRDGAVVRVGQPVIDRETHRARLEVLGRALAAREMGLGEDALRRAYEGDPEWELEVRHVIRLVEPGAAPAERAEAEQMAVEVQRRAAAGEDFAELAAEHSEEPGAAERGGLLRPGREGSWVEPFWEAAVQLEPGEVSDVVETDFGYHVIRLDDRRPVPFEEANRARLLARAVPPSAASEAMGRWVADQAGRLALDVPAILAAREMLEAGDAPDTLVLARWPEGEYTVRDLALYRITLDESARRRMTEAADQRFGQMVEEDAREAMWADAAEREGVEAPETARREAARAWSGRVGRLAASVELYAEMPVGTRRERVLELARSGRAEARAARAELRLLRPLLREVYPVRMRGESGEVTGDPAG